MFNPILVVKKTASASEISRMVGLIKDFDPDFIVNLSADLPERFAKKVEREITKRSDFISRSGGKTELKMGILAYSIFLHKLSVGEKLPDYRNVSLITPRDKKEELLFSTLYGRMDEKLFPGVKDFLTIELKVSQKRTTFPEMPVLTVVGLIELTWLTLRSYLSGGGFSPYIIFVGDPSSKVDLQEFWNLRASGKEVLFIPVKNYKSFKKPILKFIEESELVDSKFTKVDTQISPSLEKTHKKTLDNIGKWINSLSEVPIPIRMWSANWGRRVKKVSPDITCSVSFYSIEKSMVGYENKRITPFKIPNRILLQTRSPRERKNGLQTCLL